MRDYIGPAGARIRAEIYRSHVDGLHYVRTERGHILLAKDWHEAARPNPPLQTYVVTQKSISYQLQPGDVITAIPFSGQYEEWLRTSEGRELPAVFFKEAGELAQETAARIALVDEICDMLNDTVSPTALLAECERRGEHRWLYVMRENIRAVSRFQAKYAEDAT